MSSKRKHSSSAESDSGVIPGLFEVDVYFTKSDNDYYPGNSQLNFIVPSARIELVQEYFAMLHPGKSVKVTPFKPKHAEVTEETIEKQRRDKQMTERAIAMLSKNK